MPHSHRHVNTKVTTTGGILTPPTRKLPVSLAAPSTPHTSCSSLFPFNRTHYCTCEDLEVHIYPRTARYRGIWNTGMKGYRETREYMLQKA